jgi:hypothetical protein
MARSHLLARCLLAALLALAGAGLLASATRGNDLLPQSRSWPAVPPVASYQIAVTLDPTAHTLAGHEVIAYCNRSADTIDDLVFHLYLNAFRNGTTLFMRESGGVSRGFGYSRDHPGWIEVDAITWQGVDLLPASIVSETLMTTTLPQPLLPGQALTLTLDFHALLPQAFARTGFSGDFHMVGQWFPKLGVYQEGRGWNAYPFHANSEFFADFGTYDVAITVPREYVVAASGMPAGREDSPDGTTTHHYHAEAVIDFAWAAAPNFQEARRQAGPVEVVLAYLPEHASLAQRYLDAAEKALNGYGEWYGPYPYPRLTLVDVPDAAPGAGGMEYPTLVAVGMVSLPDIGENLLPELVAAHEIAHQWWQTTAASNEAEEPWLDEGFAEYSSDRLLEKAYGPDAPLLRLGFLHINPIDYDRLSYLLDPTVPVYGKAWDYNEAEYGVAVYSKPAMLLFTMEKTLGEERWLQVLRTYYQRYRFQHPTTEDFLGVVAEVAGENTRRELEPLIYKHGSLDYAVSRLECVPSGQAYRCEVTVSHEGTLALPVEIEMAFADGQVVRESWDGQGPEKRCVYNQVAPLNTVQLDPDRTLYLDASWLNNSLTRPVQTKAMVRIANPWFYAFEQIILLLGGVW